MGGTGLARGVLLIGIIGPSDGISSGLKLPATAGRGGGGAGCWGARLVPRRG